MYRFFDKHGKKVLAVAASLLMVAFLLPTTGANGCGGNHQQHGKIRDEDVSPGAIAAADAHLRVTHALIVTRLGEQPRTVADSIFGPRVASALSKDSLTFYLLLREARDAGVIPDLGDVDGFVAAAGLQYVVDPQRPESSIPFEQVNPSVQAQLKNSIAQVATVSAYFNRSMSSVKISDPLVNQRLAKEMQQVKARVVVFDAKDFQATVPAPTPEQLEQQFQAFRRQVEGSIDPANNPFGFGYRVPDKARFQYVAVPDDQAMQAVVARKNEQQWEEDARVHYLRNKTKYVKTEAPTSQPATQPTTQPQQLSFEEVRDRVYRDMREPLIDTLRKSIVNRISQQLSTDYQQASSGATAPTTQQVAERKFADLPLGSTEYLLRIRDDVQKQFGVTITVVNDSNLISQAELQKRPGIGMASLSEHTSRGEVKIGAASYLFHSIKPLVPADKLAETSPLELYQPSKPLTGGGATYVVRAVAAEPSKPAEKLDDVKEQVEKDVRRKLAFQMAYDAAQAAIKEAESGTLAKVKGVQQTDWFGLPNPQYAMYGLPTPPIKGLPEAMKSFSPDLVVPLFDLQRGLTGQDQLPVRSAIKLERRDKVVAAELFDVRTRLSPDTLAMAKERTRYALAQQLVAPVANDWFSSDAVAKRVGYSAPAHAQSDAPQRGAPAPRNPFMP